MGLVTMRDRKMQHCKMLHQTASAKNAGPAIQYAMAENVGLENAGNDIVWKTCKVQSTVRTVYSLLRSSRQLGYTPVTTLRSDLSVMFRKRNTRQYRKAEISCTLTQICASADYRRLYVQCF